METQRHTFAPSDEDPYLVRANGSRKPGTGLNEAEMLAQLQYVLFTLVSLFVP